MIFPTIQSWYAHVDGIPRKDDPRPAEQQINAAIAVLRMGEQTTCGIHSFKQDGKMGFAISAIKKRAVKLGLYQMGNGTWRAPLEPVNAPGV